MSNAGGNEAPSANEDTPFAHSEVESTMSEKSSPAKLEKGPKNLSIEMMLNNQGSAQTSTSDSTRPKDEDTKTPIDLHPTINAKDPENEKQQSKTHHTLPGLSSLSSHETGSSNLSSPQVLSSSIYASNYPPNVPSHSHLAQPYQMMHTQNPTPGPHLFQSQTPVQYTMGSSSASPQQISQMGEVKRGRRFRRRYNQIVRKYKCSYPNCTKSYGSLNHLNTHIATKKHGQRKSKEDFQDNTEIPQPSIYQQMPTQAPPVDPNTGSYWYGYHVHGSPYAQYQAIQTPLAHPPGHVPPPPQPSSTPLRQPIIPFINQSQPPPGSLYYPATPGQMHLNSQIPSTNHSGVNPALYVQSTLVTDPFGVVKQAGNAPGSGNSQNIAHDFQRSSNEPMSHGNPVSLSRHSSSGSSGSNRSTKI